jgi:general secretion pathway protein H
VVIALLSLVALLVFPRLPATEAAELRGSARSLAALLRYLGERSVTAKSHYLVRLDLAAETVTVLQRSAGGEDLLPDDPFLRRRFLADGVTLAEVETASLGRLGEGEVTVHYGPGGLAEYLAVRLVGKKGERFTVAAYPQGGKVTIAAEEGEARP